MFWFLARRIRFRSQVFDVLFRGVGIIALSALAGFFPFWRQKRERPCKPEILVEPLRFLPSLSVFQLS